MYPKNGISFAKIPFMKRFIGNINGKHGIFDFPHYDMYIGMALREYGEFSEIEFSIMKKYINQGDYDMRTALHLAAAEGQYDMVKYLVQKGANVNVKDRWNNTPIVDAKTKNHQNVVDFLIKHGA